MNRFVLAPVVLAGSFLFCAPAFAATTTTTPTTATTRPVAVSPTPGKFLVQLSVGKSKTSADTLTAKANTALAPAQFRVLTDAVKRRTAYRVVSACLTDSDAKSLVKAAKTAGYKTAFASNSKSCKA